MDRYHRPPAKIGGVTLLGLTSALVLAVLCLGGCNSTTRTDSPIDRSEFASKGLGFTLPASAHEIHYLYHSAGRGDIVFYLRFDVDPTELDAAVTNLLAANDDDYDRGKGHARMPLSSSSMISPREAFQPVSWWNPSQVTRGYHVGKEASENIRIVVDQDHSRIYYFQNE